MSYDMREYLIPKRVTNAMWDFSWLFGHYAGGPFEDFDKVTDELLERNFNSIRIDCFPWIVANLKSLNETVTMPASPLATWGVSDQDYKHCIIEELIELLKLAKKKGIYIILSNWWVNCREYSQRPDINGYKTAEEMLQRGWEIILKVIADNNLLDIILYVDFDQEFPFFSFVRGMLNDLCTNEREKVLSVNGENAMENAGLRTNSRDLKWNSAQMDLVSDYFTRFIAHFQRLYPELRFTFSLTEYWPEARTLKLASLDVLELHFWIHNPRFENRTGFVSMIKDRGEHDYKDYQLRIDKTMKAVRPMLMKEMENRLIYANEWGKECAAPIITTESWGPWWHMDHKDLKWDWLSVWCEECMRMAADFGLWGVTPWNYAHPYWNNWKDVKWYKKVNGVFLNS